MGALEARLRPGDDPPFIVTRTMGSSGPKIAPDGYAGGLICKVCGGVFFEPLPLSDGGEKAAEKESK